MRKRKFILAAAVAVSVLVIDQITKYLVVSHFSLYDSVPLIPGICNLTYIHNRGAAFGIFQNQTAPFVVVTLIALLAGAWVLYKRYYDHPLMDWAIMLVMSGGAGNLIDRVFRQGNVVDFIETAFMQFPVFNIADCAVVIGAGLLLLYLLLDLIRLKKVKP